VSSVPGYSSVTLAISEVLALVGDEFPVAELELLALLVAMDAERGVSLDLGSATPRQLAACGVVIAFVRVRELPDFWSEPTVAGHDITPPCEC
jgi:hypothetical protein